MIARKQLELPPEVARRFAKDMRAYFAEPNATKRDAIAACQLLSRSRMVPEHVTCGRCLRK